MLTEQELRQAVFALGVIVERGDQDVLESLLQEVNRDTPAGDDLENMTLRQRWHIEEVGRELALMLGEPRERCEAAALHVLGPCRQRLRFEAIVNYAISLIWPCAELTGESLFTPYE